MNSNESQQYLFQVCCLSHSSFFSDCTKTWPQFPICPEVLSPTCCAEKQAGIENTIHTVSGVVASNYALNGVLEVFLPWQEESLVQI